MDVLSHDWNEETSSLTLSVIVVKDHEHVFDFHVPPAFKLKKAVVNGVHASTVSKPNDNLAVHFTNSIAEIIDITVTFER